MRKFAKALEADGWDRRLYAAGRYGKRGLYRGRIAAPRRADRCQRCAGDRAGGMAFDRQF